ncbi:uncharacterized protein BJ212DRAFT_1497621 [Suillus subaureus]|uniref:F-box domain-containing protein n=1 Tax=Suillus subaureus TaxID=48587 RepID=A0A9P7EEF5_9AGAM|nr:uncharacterized protein BJ212DRAFT_1497621 [Suillus subaureus]KAG1818665.1 hypothetical protein BJ212DRAFT_1497621 [Suillus subaureus]
MDKDHEQFRIYLLGETDCRHGVGPFDFFASGWFIDTYTIPWQNGLRYERATLLNITEELRCYILSFLPYNQILRCASPTLKLCRTMHTTVKNSVDLQYAIELGAQGLVQVHPPIVSIAECLRILREKANACILDNLALRLIPQRLSVTLSTGKEHLSASGSQLVTVTRAPDKRLSSRAHVYHCAFVNVLGDRLALYGEAAVKDGYGYWSLHVWNWHEGVQADVGVFFPLSFKNSHSTFPYIKDICVVGEGYRSFSEIRFLTKEKLLAFTSYGHIEPYDVEDLSKAPRLQARFTLPYNSSNMHLYGIQYPPVLHSASSCAHLATPDNHWIWTTNTADRVLCLSNRGPGPLFVITARLFFMNIPPSWFDATSEDGLSVPWSSWGPQNSRCFSGSLHGAGGSRVVSFAKLNNYNDQDPVLLRMMDFNTSAVARGIGKVVREATTYHSFNKDEMSVTTYLPYIEAISSCILHNNALSFALDEEQVALLEQSECISTCQVNDVQHLPE